jgi:imidazolonepropionase-like amidohydrolase
MTATLIINLSQVVSCAGPARARRGAEQGDAGVRDGVGVAIGDDGRIFAVAPDRELRAAHPGAVVVDGGQGVLTPGWVDSHTHAIFGRARYE